ncbi:MAG: tail fiber domain-containing protein [Campylobacterota bacterium]|nr:tail fiber domain-containing protein [Campylobacterota bacterium]
MYNIHKPKLTSLVAFMATVVLSTSSYAIDIPSKISYQGKLLDAGVAVNGTKSITFSLSSGWTETHSNVTIDGGLYSVQLGSINPIPVSAFSTGSNVDLQISVEGEDLTPTLDVLSVGYAFVAQNAKDADKLSGNVASHYLDWNNLTNVPAGFADGVDDEGSASPTAETDPIFSASAAKNITSTSITNWNTATSWGNHASAGYLSAESDPVWSSVAGNYYTKAQISAVGTSGSYNDLTNKPTIPNTSNFVDMTSYQPFIKGRKTFKDILYLELGARIDDDVYIGSLDSNPQVYAELGVIGNISVYDGRLKVYDEDKILHGSIYGTGDANNHTLKIISYGGDIDLVGDVYAEADAYKPGGGSWSVSSDRRLKDIGKSYANGLETVNTIEPIYYNYKKDNPLKLPSEETYVGVIAQEVQKVIPDAVTENENGYLTVNNDPIIWAMLNAIKELSKEVNTLKMELKTMKEAIK